MRFLVTAVLTVGLSLVGAAQSTDEFEASILGEVKTQRKSRFHSGATLLDLWLSSGGATARTDLETAVLVRNEREIPVDLRPEHSATLTQTRLLPSDVLLVSPGRRLGVTGEVRDPGIYAVSFKSKTPIEAALMAAGGVKETAALSRVLLVRPTMPKPVVIDLASLTSEGTVKLPLPLEDGDTLVVPPRKCVIVGDVPRQGQVLLRGQDKLCEIVSAAGVRAEGLKQVTLIRSADVEAGNDKKEVYDLSALSESGTGIPKIAIFDGDVIFVPGEKQPQFIDYWSKRPFFYYDRVLFSF